MSERSTRRTAVVALVALIAACSSGDDSKSTSPSTAPTTLEATTSAVATTESTPDSSVTDTSPSGQAITSAYDCPTAEAPDPSQPIDLTFWHVQTGTAGEVIDALAAEYDAAHPEVTITSIYQDPQVAFVPAVTSGEIPDLISAVNANFMQLAIDSQAVLPIGACLAADEVDVSDFLPRMLGATTKEGELWALPFFHGELVMFYNPLAFEAAGLDPNSPPRTLDELHTMSQQIVESGYTKHGVAWTPNSAVLQTLFSLSSQPFVDEDNGRSGRATELTIDNEAGLQAFTTLQAMVNDGTAITVVDRFDGLLAAGSRDVAMALAVSYDLTNITEAVAIQDFPGVELGIARIPSVTGDEGGAADVRGESLFLLDGPDPGRVAAAYRFALWLSEAAQQARLHVEANSVPARASTAEEPSVIEYWEAMPLARFAFDDLSSAGAPPGGGGAILGQPLQINDLVSAAWIEASKPGADAAAILERLVSEANAVIADYNARAEVGG